MEVGLPAVPLVPLSGDIQPSGVKPGPDLQRGDIIAYPMLNEPSRVEFLREVQAFE